MVPFALRIFPVLALGFLGCSRGWAIGNRLSDPEDADGSGQRESGEPSPRIIFPGTKWCGSGNVAEDYDDLGTFAETDACCRAHDHCEDAIEGGRSAHGLTNPAFYTRVLCACDERFYDCLRDSGDNAGGKVGTAYFTLLGTQCFRDDYPVVGCRRRSTYPRRCLEYELDESQPKRYQWFDVPPFRGSSPEESESLSPRERGPPQPPPVRKEPNRFFRDPSSSRFS
ncbi:phospholipase A2 [Orussus abietinus]|uniref:phospholipase A2 n=1 Tax=Orussus abietinus TaxID=222816 RepID=UPI000626D686|nr:phospholipase A2 [Orussus abietinus]